MRAVTLFIVVVLFSNLAWASDSLRCGSSLLTAESTVSEFLAKCGEPTKKESVVEDIRASNRGASFKVGTSTTEKWTYERKGRLPVLVTIVDGQVTALEVLVK
jgi:hypothetical protein